ncbi:Conserved uncharacterized protein [Stigmatella aurantiaca DW4/3-1]|uniref:Conserved uncharacterized protein n=1 Tax=Stigmatella aurantiaca (strain DW4/3-1) TaxID=378806 RepID=E3FNX0_STIAD|nr:Conserved uncharacterized protein [Stigmatella aurantiaca DW4/3-1]
MTQSRDMPSLIHERAVKECRERQVFTPEVATVRGLIFNAVLGLVSRHQGEASAAELRGLVSKKSYIDFFPYPARDFLQLLYGAAEVLAPYHGDSLDEAIRACGAAAVSGFFQSAVGRTLTNLIGRGDPKRLFSNAPTAYSTTVGYGQRTYTRLNDRAVRLHFRGDMQPVQFHQGVLEEALAAVGCKGRVRVRVLGLDEAEYTIEWE